MNRPFAYLFAILLAGFLAVPATALMPEEIYSGTAVLMDTETGQVLFDKNMREKVYPASTTKIMTALLVVERCDPTEIITVSDSALDIDEWDSANIELRSGEQLTVEDALYALMLPSANDAANALAEHVAGSQEAFARMMTERAHAVGASDTNFTNAHGLHDGNHYTTAYDMALITRHASENRLFMRYFGAADHTVPATNLQPEPREFHNYQYMLVPDSDFYDPTVMGGKVGYTNPAMHTMSTIARKYGMSLVCVTMKSARNEKFYDTASLFRYGFHDFRRLTLPASEFQAGRVSIMDGESEAGMVEFSSGTDFTFLLRNDLSLADVYVDYELPGTFAPGDMLPVTVNVRVGTVFDGLPTLLGTQPVRAAVTRNVRAVPAAAVARDEEPEGGTVLVIGLGTLTAILAVLCVRGGIALHRRNKIRKRRVRRMARLSQARKPQILR